MKNLTKISVLIMLIALASCSSNSFSKRKYQKGVFKEHSERVRRDKSKAEETFFASKSELEIKDQAQEPIVLQSDELIGTNSFPIISKEIRTQEVNSNKKIITERISNSKFDHSTHSKETQKKLKKKSTNLNPEERIKRDKIILSLSVIICLILAILFAIFLVKILLGISIWPLLIIGLLFLTFLGLAIWAKVDLNKTQRQLQKENNHT